MCRYRTADKYDCNVAAVTWPARDATNRRMSTSVAGTGGALSSLQKAKNFAWPERYCIRVDEASPCDIRTSHVLSSNSILETVRSAGAITRSERIIIKMYNRCRVLFNICFSYCKVKSGLAGIQSNSLRNSMGIDVLHSSALGISSINFEKFPLERASDAPL